MHTHIYIHTHSHTEYFSCLWPTFHLKSRVAGFKSNLSFYFLWSALFHVLRDLCLSRCREDLLVPFQRLYTVSFSIHVYNPLWDDFSLWFGIAVEAYFSAMDVQLLQHHLLERLSFAPIELIGHIYHKYEDQLLDSVPLIYINVSIWCQCHVALIIATINYCFGLLYVACKFIVPLPGIESMPLMAEEVWCPKHWTPEKSLLLIL